MSDYILELKGITKIFPGVKALNNVQFQLKKGEEFLDENYGGSLPSFVAAFASRKKLSKDDIAYLKKIIDESR